MTWDEIKDLARKEIKVVAGGPTNRTRGKGLLGVVNAIIDKAKDAGSGLPANLLSALTAAPNPNATDRRFVLLSELGASSYLRKGASTGEANIIVGPPDNACEIEGEAEVSTLIGGHSNRIRSMTGFGATYNAIQYGAGNLIEGGDSNLIRTGNNVTITRSSKCTVEESTAITLSASCLKVRVENSSTCALAGCVNVQLVDCNSLTLTGRSDEFYIRNVLQTNTGDGPLSEKFDEEGNLKLDYLPAGTLPGYTLLTQADGSPLLDGDGDVQYQVDLPAFLASNNTEAQLRALIADVIDGVVPAEEKAFQTVVGDSLNNGYSSSNPATQNWPFLQQAKLDPTTFGTTRNFSQDGTHAVQEIRVNQTNNALAAMDEAYASGLYKVFTAIITGGVNDFLFQNYAVADVIAAKSATVQRYRDWAADKPDIKLKVILFTVATVTSVDGIGASAANAKSQQLNTDLKANYQSVYKADYLVNLDGITGLKALLNTDGLHYKDAGYAAIADHVLLYSNAAQAGIALPPYPDAAGGSTPTPSLNAPTLSVGSVLMTSVVFTRSSVANATAYPLKISTAADFSVSPLTVNLSSESQAVTGLTASTTYYATVQATAEGYTSSAFTSISFQTAAPALALRETIEQGDPRVARTGTYSEIGATPLTSGGALYTETAGDSAELPFTGRQVELHTGDYAQDGLVSEYDVYVDGVLDGTAQSPSPAPTGSARELALRYTTKVYADGPHVIRLVNKRVMIVDKFNVLG